MENKNVLETNFNSAENEQDIDKSQYEYLDLCQVFRHNFSNNLIYRI